MVLSSPFRVTKLKYHVDAPVENQCNAKPTFARDLVMVVRAKSLSPKIYLFSHLKNNPTLMRAPRVDSDVRSSSLAAHISARPLVIQEESVQQLVPKSHESHALVSDFLKKDPALD